MIHIVDYGLGNIQAFLTVFKRLGVEARRASTAEELQGAEKLILPGVGAFDHAMMLLDHSGMRATLETLVLGEKRPVLGVCVGMQILASGSDEGKSAGLGWVPGRVRSFRSEPRAGTLPLPHMGWNDVRPKEQSRLFSGLNQDPRFYFLHSFFFECDDPAYVSAVATYGFDFICAVSAANIHGVQFHPEKSHHYGVQLLKNFAEL